MKQSLSLKLGQSLTMTPQLQQAIKLLQLSSLELDVEVQQAIETNPMLEISEDSDDAPANDDADDGPLEPPETVSASETGAETGSETDGDSEFGDGESAFDTETAIDTAETQITEDLPVDSNWEDVYQGMPAPAPSAAPEDDNFDDRNAIAESLTDHLLWQLNVTPMTDRDQAIALAIIDAIDADGMLSADIEDLADSFGAEWEIETDEVLAVLKLVQQFDPAGVGARNLAECLLLQLRQLDPAEPWREEAIILIEQHIDLLAARDFATLRRRAKLDEDSLRAVMELIQSLNPRPGASLGNDDLEYVEPDVIVKKDGDRWKVELNPATTPRVRINPDYACLVRRADNSDENTYLRNNLQEARWFLKSLQSRSETLLKVATKIVEHQRGFLEYGEEAMKPLVLADIAEAVEMHESTISRVTTRKYMLTPRGLYELKYFFSSHVGTNTGGEVSSTAIRALIKKLTADENPQKPLSDSKIAALLNEQNISVARRTVAKYRESMAIPPSNERKRLI